MVVLGVDTAENGGEAEKAGKFRDAHSLTYPILLDVGNKVAGQFGVMATPTNVVIDQKGVVRAVETGFNPGSLDQTVSGLLTSG